MRYIKTYEEIKLKFNVGDYVILDLDKIEQDQKDQDYKYGHVTPIDNIVKIVRYLLQHQDQYYKIVFYNGMDDDFYLITDDDILREATTEEIENFKEKQKLDKVATKYNL